MIPKKLKKSGEEAMRLIIEKVKIGSERNKEIDAEEEANNKEIRL